MNNHMMNFDFLQAIDLLKGEIDRAARMIGTTYEQEQPHASKPGTEYGIDFKDLMSKNSYHGSSTQLDKEFIRWQIAQLEHFKSHLAEDTGTNLYNFLPIALSVGEATGFDIRQRIKQANDALTEKRSKSGSRVGEFDRVVKQVTLSVLDREVSIGQYWESEHEMLDSVKNLVLKIPLRRDYKKLKTSNWSSETFLKELERLRHSDEEFDNSLMSLYSRSDDTRKQLKKTRLPT